MFKLFKLDLSISDITNVREQLFNSILYLFSVLGFLAVVVGGTELYYQGALPLVIIYLIVYISVVCCLVLKKYLSYHFRVIFFLSMLYFLAFFLLYRFGLSGTGIHILITISLLATVFLDVRAGIKVVVFGLFSIILIGTCMSKGLIPTDIATLPNSTQLIAWTAVGMIFLVIGMMMVVGPGILQLSLLKEVTKVRRSESINKTLYSISNAVNITLDLQDLYKHIHYLLGDILDVTNFFIAVVDNKENTLYFPYYVDTVDDDFYPIINFDTNDSLTGLVVSKKGPLLLKKEELDKREAQNGVHGPAPLIWMGAPLIIKDKVIGVIALQSYVDPDLFNEKDLEMLAAVWQCLILLKPV